MKLINICLTISLLYGIALVIRGAFEIGAYSEQISNLEDKNIALESQNEVIQDEINAWQNREGYLRYKLNYIGVGEKFLILEK